MNCHLFNSYIITIFILLASIEPIQSQQLTGFDTNTEKRSIDLDELIDGGPGKDGIPSIDQPQFIAQEEAVKWLNGREPVISLEINGEAKAYPIQILIWHEITNDEIGGVPVAVTFCPLCYSSIVFDRRHNGDVLEFGVSGFLRHSDMIMYDRQTESMWQQFSGESLIGEYTGDFLTILSSQLISFDQFRETYPDARVLSRNTGHRRNYGENPYAGYDDINNSPLMLREEVSDEIPPMEKVIGVRTDREVKGYTYSVTKAQKVLHDEVGGEPIVIFHLDGMVSALDNRSISRSRDDGATGVFSSILDGEQMEFEFKNGEIRDVQTGSIWSITGKAISGLMKGRQLYVKVYGDYFAFAWLVFYPETEMIMEKQD